MNRILPLFVVCLLSGCATPSDQVHEAESSVESGKYEEGLKKLKAMSEEGGGMQREESRAAYLRSRTVVAEKLIGQARRAAAEGRLDDAEQLYGKLLAIEPGYLQARVELKQVQIMKQRRARLSQAEALFGQGKLDDAQKALQQILLEQPDQAEALELMRKITERQQRNAAPTLGPQFSKTVSLEFRDAKLKDIFDAIWNASGINFILDKDVRTDANASIYVHNVTIKEAIDGLLMTQQLARKVVNGNTLFIYPDTPQKRTEYQDLVVRNFFLAHADAKQIESMLKTILKIKDIYVDEKRNLVVIRDSQDNVDLAEKLVRAHDQAEPEVMLALDVIEITKSKLNEMGISLPNQVDFGVGNPLTLRQLRNLNSSGINVGIGGLSSGTATTNPGVVGSIKLNDTNGDINMLANPRVRVRNGDKAKIHIGDRLPVVTTTVSGISSFVGQSVNYLDVGLMLEVEPHVMLDGDVSVKLNLEVSSAKQDPNNAGLYDVGTRTATTVLSIHDGETQMLAGLIRQDESDTTSSVPGIANIPLLGRLFSDVSKSKGKTEIVLAITPHIIHNLVRPSSDLMEYSSGTGSFSSSGGMPLQPGGPSLRPGGFMPGRPEPSAPSPQPGRRSGAAAPASTGGAASPAPAAAQGGVIPLGDFSPPPGVGMKP